MFSKTIILVATCLSLCAGQPQLRTLRATWDPYVVPLGCSNVVIVIYKSTSLGLVWTPFKPTAFTPAARTNQAFQALSGGTYRFYITAQGQPLLESDPSNTVTSTVQ